MELLSNEIEHHSLGQDVIMEILIGNIMLLVMLIDNSSQIPHVRQQ
jgi:hypothetical protein